MAYVLNEEVKHSTWTNMESPHSTTIDYLVETEFLLTGFRFFFSDIKF